VNHLHQQPRVPWSILITKVNVKNTLTSHIDKKYPWYCCWLPYLYTFSLYENPSFTIVCRDRIFLWKCLYQVRVITVFPVFRLLTDFVCLYTCEFWLSLWKIVRSSVILLLPLFKLVKRVTVQTSTTCNCKFRWCCKVKCDKCESKQNNYYCVK
jgi:hypothetical protein